MIEFGALQTNASIKTLTWKVPELFDKAWHKVRFGVFQTQHLSNRDGCKDDLSIVLYVDCKLIENAKLLENVCLTKLDVDGDIRISSDKKTKSTIPIDIQHMVIMCDPKRIGYELCE